MKRIGFIGAYDKSNLIIYVAKILQLLNYRVMVVDTTRLEKTKYIVPSIDPTKSYITNFENIDFAIGFENWEEIEKYLGLEYDSNDENINKEEKEEQGKDEPYDYVLLDIDSQQKFKNFNIKNTEKNYFVTSFDIYSLRKGLSVFESLYENVKLTKILFSYNISKEEEEYLNTISNNYNITWSEYAFYFKIFDEDEIVLQENQRLEKIRFKRLSITYRETLAYVVADINKKLTLNNIKKVMKE